MSNLIIICSILLLLPFMLSYIHVGANKKTPARFIYYRYFMTFNMILAGLFVAGRMFINGRGAAATSGWLYSPMFKLYGIAILSMVILALLTLFVRSILMIAPAIVWTVFLLLSSLSHLHQIRHHEIAVANIIIVHVIYNLTISIIMLRYVLQIMNYFKGHSVNSNSNTVAANA